MGPPPDPTMPVGPPPGSPPSPPGGFGPPPGGGGPYGPTSGGFGAPPPKKGPNPALIVGIIVLVIGLIAGGAFFVMSGDDDEEGSGGDGDRTTTSEGGGSDSTETPITTGGGDSTETTSGGGGGGGEGQSCEDYELGQFGDVLADFAAYIYCNTPQGVTEDDGICLAEAVLGVVGEDTVVSADYEPQTIYGSTSGSEDAEIRTAAYSCTTGEADSVLADETGGFWPDPWNPASS